ncbi:MAG: ribosomal L7Ae/L30e/S12e/Gadd45 family protein [Syntrophomonadaceae bacterium]
MLLEEIENSKKVVGSKQVRKAVTKGTARTVYLAKDAEPHITKPLIEVCQQHAVKVEMIDTMVELGHACGIEVGSAAVALLKE